MRVTVTGNESLQVIAMLQALQDSAMVHKAAIKAHRRALVKCMDAIERVELMSIKNPKSEAGEQHGSYRNGNGVCS